MSIASAAQAARVFAEPPSLSSAPSSSSATPPPPLLFNTFRQSVDLVKALELSKRPVPPELQAMAEAYFKKKLGGSIKVGDDSTGLTMKGHGSGFGGKGYKFDEDEQRKFSAVSVSERKLTF
jgi:hypothetical protein